MNWRSPNSREDRYTQVYQILLEEYRPEAARVEVERQTEATVISRNKRKYCSPCYVDTKKQRKSQYYCEKRKKCLCLRLHTKLLCQECFENISEVDAE